MQSILLTVAIAFMLGLIRPLVTVGELFLAPAEALLTALSISVESFVRVPLTVMTGSASGASEVAPLLLVAGAAMSLYLFKVSHLGGSHHGASSPSIELEPSDESNDSDDSDESDESDPLDLAHEAYLAGDITELELDALVEHALTDEQLDTPQPDDYGPELTDEQREQLARQLDKAQIADQSDEIQETDT